MFLVISVSGMERSRVSVEEREKLLNAVRYLMKYYRELWENYEKGAYVKQYIQLLRRISENEAVNGT